MQPMSFGNLAFPLPMLKVLSGQRIQVFLRHIYQLTSSQVFQLGTALVQKLILAKELHQTIKLNITLQVIRFSQQ